MVRVSSPGSRAPIVMTMTCIMYTRFAMALAPLARTLHCPTVRSPHHDARRAIAGPFPPNKLAAPLPARPIPWTQKSRPLDRLAFRWCFIIVRQAVSQRANRVRDNHIPCPRLKRKYAGRRCTLYSSCSSANQGDSCT